MISTTYGSPKLKQFLVENKIKLNRAGRVMLVIHIDLRRRLMVKREIHSQVVHCFRRFCQVNLA